MIIPEKNILQSPAKNDNAYWPRISVITPSYNQGQFIEETIESVLRQAYPNIEYIIIDGGSTDQSMDIVKNHASSLTYWVSEPDRGQGHAINKGLEHATGEIIFWLNADDLCLPGAFQTAALAFQADSDLALVIGQAQVIDSTSQIIGELHSQFTSWDDLLSNPRNSIRQVATFFSRSLFRELGLIDENLQIALDTELLIRFTQFHTPLILDEYLAAFRIHSNAKSFNQLVRGYQESDHVRNKYFQNKDLAALYHHRSAASWLTLSTDHKLKVADRFRCIINAMINQPSIIFSRRYISCLRRIGINTIQTLGLPQDRF